LVFWGSQIVYHWRGAGFGALQQLALPSVTAKEGLAFLNFVVDEFPL